MENDYHIFRIGVTSYHKNNPIVAKDVRIAEQQLADGELDKVVNTFEEITARTWASIRDIFLLNNCSIRRFHHMSFGVYGSPEACYDCKVAGTTSNVLLACHEIAQDQKQEAVLITRKSVQNDRMSTLATDAIIVIPKEIELVDGVTVAAKIKEIGISGAQYNPGNYSEIHIYNPPTLSGISVPIFREHIDEIIQYVRYKFGRKIDVIIDIYKHYEYLNGKYVNI